MDEANRSYFLPGDTGPSFLHRGGSTIVEGHRVDNACRLRCGEKFEGFRRGRRQGFIGNIVLAVPQRGKDDRAMQIVRSCGVDYINIRVPRKYIVSDKPL